MSTTLRLCAIVVFLASGLFAQKSNKPDFSGTWQLDLQRTRFGDVPQPKSMVILFENTLFGTSLSKAVQAWAKEVGIEVTNFEPYEAGAIDFKPMLLKVKAKNPDVVFMVSYLMDAMLLMRQSKELDINPKIFAGGAAGFTMPEFIEGARAAAEYVFSATLWAPDVKYPGAREFYDKYFKKYGVHPEYHSTEG